MTKPATKLPDVRAWLERRRGAWADRLLPKTHKDAWRGSARSQRGVRGFSYLNFPGVSFFVLRRTRVSSTGIRHMYTLAVIWRLRWYVTIPLSPATLAPLLPCLSSFNAVSTRVPSGAAVFLETTTLVSKLFSMDFRLFTFWHTLFRGLGGVSRLKIRYKGKSFKWHRHRGALLLRFGHSHLVAMSPLPGLRWRRFGRMKIVLYGSNWWDLAEFAQSICWWRPANVYHGRGIRLRRQVILRKSGKVSAYR